MSAATVEIIVGRSWKLDAHCLARLYNYRGQNHFDFSPITDIIDIVVDGANLTSRLPEESVFCVMLDLLSGLVSMQEGRLDKHIVAFQEAPFELALQRSHGVIELSFYGTGSAREVVAHNRRVDEEHLLRRVVEAAEQLVDDLVEVNGAFANDGMVRGMEQLLKSLRAQRRAAQTPPTNVPSTAGRIEVALNRGRLGLDLSFDATHSDFWRYQGALSEDLHSLLFQGTARLTYFNKSKVLAKQTYLYLVLEGLVRGVERLMQVLQRGSGGCVLLDGSGPGESLVTAEMLDQKHVLLRIREPGAAMGQTRVTPENLVGLLLEGAKRLLQHITAANPRQMLNHRVTDLLTQVDQLQGELASLRQGDIYFEKVQRYLKEAPQVVAPDPAATASPRVPYPLEKLRRLFLKSAWFVARRQIDFPAVSRRGSNLIVPSRGLLESIDGKHGTSNWSVPADKLVASLGDVLLVHRGDALMGLHHVNGKPRWTSPAQLGSGPALAFQLGGRPVFAVVRGGHGVSLLDQASGQPLWERDLDHGQAVGLCLAGPVLVVLADDAFACGLAPGSGELLWKIRLPGFPTAGPVAHQGRLYALSEGEHGVDSVFVSLYPLTGRRVFERRLPAPITHRLMLVGMTGLVVMETPLGTRAMGLDLEEGRPLWSFDLDVANLAPPVLTRLRGRGRDGIAIKTDRGHCLALNPRDGSVRWRQCLLEPTESLMDNAAPAFLSGHLLVPERGISVLNAQTGHRVHRFEELPEHPSHLRVESGLRLILGEGEDHLECFDLQGFLALVG